AWLKRSQPFNGLGVRQFGERRNLLRGGANHQNPVSHLDQTDRPIGAQSHRLDHADGACLPTRRHPPRVEDRHHVHERKDQRKPNEKAQHRAPQLASPGVKRGGKGSAHSSFLPSRNSLKSEPRYSLSTGFTSTLYAPATLALRTTGEEAAAVTTKTVALGWSRLIAGNRSIPSTSGNATSNRIRSNRFPLRQAKASLPLAAS